MGSGDGFSLNGESDAHESDGALAADAQQDPSAGEGRQPEDEAVVEAMSQPADLEAGVAAIFATLRESDAHAGAATPREDDGELPVDSGVTFELLGELDRLWRSPAA